MFFEDADYEDFIRLLRLAKQRFALKIFGVCVMPNHYHALARPEAEGALSAYFHWVQGCYACDLRSRTRTLGNGHVFQQRFWSGPIVDGFHFLTSLRYIEANPAACHLVPRAEDWRWSSLSLRTAAETDLLDPLPLTLPLNWSDYVNGEPFAGEPE